MTKTMSQEEVKKMFQKKKLAISRIGQVIKDLRKENSRLLDIVDVLLKYAAALGNESLGSGKKQKEFLKDGFSRHVDGKVIYKLDNSP